MSFDALPHADWPPVAACLSRPWPPAAAMHDLRWHAAEHHVHRRPLPTERDLAARWGWSKTRTHDILACAAWRDLARPWGWRSDQTPTTIRPRSDLTRVPLVHPAPGHPPPETQSEEPPAAAGSVTAGLPPGEEPVTSSRRDGTWTSPPVPGDRALAVEFLDGDVEWGAPPAASGPPVPTPAADPLPAWVPAARACGGHPRADVCAMVVRAVEAARGAPPNPARCGTDAATILALWRRLGTPPPPEMAADLVLVAEWARDSADRAAARDLRAEGWDGGRDRHRDLATLCRHERWATRLDLARQWDQRGRDDEASDAPAAPRESAEAAERRANHGMTLAELDAIDRECGTGKYAGQPPSLRLVSA